MSDELLTLEQNPDTRKVKQEEVRQRLCGPPAPDALHSSSEVPTRDISSIADIEAQSEEQLQIWSRALERPVEDAQSDNAPSPSSAGTHDAPRVLPNRLTVEEEELTSAVNISTGGDSFPPTSTGPPQIPSPISFHSKPRNMSPFLSEALSSESEDPYPPQSPRLSTPRGLDQFSNGEGYEVLAGSSTSSQQSNRFAPYSRGYKRRQRKTTAKIRVVHGIEYQDKRIAKMDVWYSCHQSTGDEPIEAPPTYDDAALPEYSIFTHLSSEQIQAWIWLSNAWLQCSRRLIPSPEPCSYPGYSTEPIALALALASITVHGTRFQLRSPSP
ncbi:hypothetical protein ONZ45_g3265 [Pleurotus djamor]|nr:hypothetical protein ONZ45_g3265 [Pleurotus djamor]